MNLLAKVCVKKLPPDPQGDRTRISWDLVHSGQLAHLKPDASGSTSRHLFPADRTHRVGDCATGWIPFATRASPSKIKYSNGLGDTAVWNARNLDADPETGHVTAVTPIDQDEDAKP